MTGPAAILPALTLVQTKCVDTAAAGICGAADYKCMCASNSKIRPGAVKCVEDCGETTQVQAAVGAFCKCMGVNIG
jgi:hypothetical protein